MANRLRPSGARNNLLQKSNAPFLAHIWKDIDFPHSRKCSPSDRSRPQMDLPYWKRSSSDRSASAVQRYLFGLRPDDVISVVLHVLRVPVSRMNAAFLALSRAASSASISYGSDEYLISQRLTIPSSRSITRSICAPPPSAAAAVRHE